jgi:hypothetical protein
MVALVVAFFLLLVVGAVVVFVVVDRASFFRAFLALELPSWYCCGVGVVHRRCLEHHGNCVLSFCGLVVLLHTLKEMSPLRFLLV